jgi:hypothetical protein
MDQSFAIGEELKFSQKGLKLWCDNLRPGYDTGRYQLWRWCVVGHKEHYFLNGDNALILKRVDYPRNRIPAIKRPIALWHPAFFEKVSAHEESTDN